MITKERSFFIKMLSDHLTGQQTTDPGNIDWMEVANLARSHQVDGILYRQCKEYLPKEIKQSLASAYVATLLSFVNRKKALDEVTEALNNEGITFFEVKGFKIAQYYPIPELRTMGDCDLIIHRSEMPSAIAVMRNLGYSGIDNDHTHDWDCNKNDITFELHDWLVQNVEHTQPDQEAFFNEHFDEYVHEGILDWNFHFLYLLMHLRKHFMNTGVGIRQFVDIAVFLHQGPALNWQWIESRLEELRLLKFAQSCFTLIHNWFGVDSPIEGALLDDDFSEKVTEKILDNGVFGFQNESNQGNYERNVLIKSGKYLFANRLKLLIQKTFPPYSNMRAYPGTNYVDGRPYLLPVAWFHRFILYKRRHGEKSTIRRIVNGSLTRQERLNEQKYYFDNMGL